MKAPFAFHHYDHLPGCRVWIDTVFKGFCALNYAHSGQIRLAVDGGATKILTAPVAWWTWPGPRFEYGQTQSPGWDHYYVTFRGPWVDQLRRSGWMPSSSANAYCFIHNAEAFRTKMERLQAALDHHDQEHAWLLLQDMFLDLRTQKPPSANQGPHEKKLQLLIARIRRQPARDWIEVEAASSCGISQVHFRRVFREAAGLPFRQFCLKARMDAAARMLRKSKLPLKEIAERCGISDIYYFNRLFRARHGMPPGAYAREARMLGLSEQ